MTDAERVQKAIERGEILRVLKEGFTEALMSTRVLRGALDMLGISLSMEDLAFHLTYLSQQGYVEMKRVRDLPGFRSDRALPSWEKPDTIKFARLAPKGLQLLDGLIAEDPSVRF